MEVKTRKIKFKLGDVKFNKGAIVEVRSGVHCSWYTAVILGFTEKEKLVVEYGSLREEVGVNDVRPCPPQIPQMEAFKELDEVDAWYNDGWWVGVVSKVIDALNYVVYFRSINDEMEFQHSHLRPHQEWVDGNWVISSKKTTFNLDGNSGKIKLKIKFGGQRSEAKFNEGDVVEVRNHEEGYLGSWYVAVIVGLKENHKFLVEYRTLKTDDGTDFVREEAYARDIRPCPPDTQRLHPFKQLEEVDVWFNDGWWIGVVSKVLSVSKYIVYFRTTNEEMEIKHANLRAHQEWIDGKWVVASQIFSSELKKSRRVKFKIKHDVLALHEPEFKIKHHGQATEAKLNIGSKVEVRSDEAGFEGAWFVAFIVGLSGNKKFLVEYQNLMTDDESQLLREEAYAHNIRPCPPEIDRVDCFKYLEEVDAWFNDGWWVGVVTKVLGGSRYIVYFRTTNEAFEFDHISLRPHQHWIDGKWVLSSQD